MPPPEVIEGKKKYWHHGIRPNTFKLLIGKGHSEFGTKKQQDAQEFFLYFLSLIEVFLYIYLKSDNPVYNFMNVFSAILKIPKIQQNALNLILKTVINVQLPDKLNTLIDQNTVCHYLYHLTI